MSNASSTASPLPSGWEVAEISKVARINPALDCPVPADEDIVNFVPMRAVEPEGGGLLRPEVRPYREVKKGYTAFQSGDVIMAKITPCMENGKITVVPELPGTVCFGSTEFHVLRAENGIEPKWLANFLLQHEVRRTAQRTMTGGVGQMRVPANFLEGARIPVAPAAEQQRIADIIDELMSDLDAGVVTLHRVQKKLGHYRASVLKAAVEGALTKDWRQQHPDTEPAPILLARILDERRKGWEKDQLDKFAVSSRKQRDNWKAKYRDPVVPDTTNLGELPTGWCWATVDQCSRRIQYGTSAKTNGNENGIPVLRMGNIRQDGSLALDELKYLTREHNEFPELLLRQGDLLFNRTNSAELVGKTGIYRGTPDPCSFASYLIRIRLVEGVLPAFLSFCMNGMFGRRWVKEVASQTVGQANINGTKLGAFAFPLPPLPEQESIVEIAEDQLSVIDHLHCEIKAKLTYVHSLRQATFRSAFAGQLIQQDPSDEAASELLNRIATEREKRSEQITVRKIAQAKPIAVGEHRMIKG